MYGTQTKAQQFPLEPVFENDVKMYGTQTNELSLLQELLFENDVKMYGVQHPNTQKHAFCHLQHPVRVFMCTLSLAFFHSLQNSSNVEYLSFLLEFTALIATW